MRSIPLRFALQLSLVAPVVGAYGCRPAEEGTATSKPGDIGGARAAADSLWWDAKRMRESGISVDDAAIAGWSEYYARGQKILLELSNLDSEHRRTYDIKAFRGEKVAFGGSSAPPGGRPSAYCDLVGGAGSRRGLASLARAQDDRPRSERGERASDIKSLALTCLQDLPHDRHGCLPGRRRAAGGDGAVVGAYAARHRNLPGYPDLTQKGGILHSTRSVRPLAISRPAAFSSGRFAPATHRPGAGLWTKPRGRRVARAAQVTGYRIHTTV